MGNEVRIVITGKDQSGPAFDGPSKSVADLAKNLAKVSGQLTNAGTAFGKTASQATSMGTAVSKAGDRAAGSLSDAAKGAHEFAGAAKRSEDAARKSAPAYDEAGKKAQGFGKALHGVASSAGGILAADTFRGAAERAKEFFGSSIEAASSLGESLNAVDKIFGNSSGQIKSWGEQNATSFGLSQRAFNEMAVPLGAMLRNAGVDMDTVSTNTVELTKRAADMASVFNTDVSQALEAIQAGLRGESDPLEQYGVGLNAAAVEARALADTGKASAAALTDQEKMLARVALIMEQTSTSAGDFADTQDGLANATRIANAQMEEAQAKLGSALLPVMAKAAQSAGDLATEFSNLPEPVQATVAGVGALAAATIILVPRLAATKVALLESGVISEGTAGKLDKLAKASAAVGIAAVGLDVIGSWASKLGGESKGIDQMTDALQGFAKTGDMAGDLTNTWVGGFGDMEKAGGSMGLAMRQALDPTFLDSWANPADKVIGMLPGFSDRMEQATEKFHSMDAALAEMQSSGHADDAGAAFERIKRLAAELNLPMDRLKELFPEYSKAVEAAGTATDGAATAADKAAGANKDLAESVDEVTGKLFASEQAEEDYQGAIDDANQLIKENRKAHRDAADALDIHTEAGRKNREALRLIAEKAKDVIDKMIEMKDPMANVVAVAGNQRAEFIKVATAMLGSKKAAEELATKYGLIPKSVETKIKGDTKQAKGALADFLHQINSSKPKPIPIGADASRAYGVLNKLLHDINGSSASPSVGVLKKGATGGVMGRYATGGLTGVGDFPAYASGGSAPKAPHKPPPKKKSVAQTKSKSTKQSTGPGKKAQLEAEYHGQVAHANYVEPSSGGVHVITESSSPGRKAEMEASYHGQVSQRLASGLLADFLRQVRGVLRQLLAAANNPSAGLGRYAQGGLAGVSGGAVALVGEEGPELVALPYGSKVIPAGQTASILDDEDDYPGYASGGAAPKAPHTPPKKKTAKKSTAQTKSKSVGQSSGPGRKATLEASYHGQIAHRNYVEPQIGDAVSVDIGSAVSTGGSGDSLQREMVPIRRSLQHAISQSNGRVQINYNVNLHVAGSIRSDRDLVALIRNEFYNGGFRGVVQTA